MMLRAWQRFRQTARTDWPWLVLEFAVVVAGVTLSFALQDWRDQRDAGTDRHRLLKALRDDLLTDVAMLEQDLAVLDALAAAHWLVLDEERRGAASPEDLDTALDRIITYKVFTPNDTTWRMMESTGSLTLMDAEALLPRVVRLYEQGYPGVEEWAHINRDFVLRELIPFVDAHAPFVGATEDALSVAGLHRTLPTLVALSHYMNLVRTGRLYKSAQRAVTLGVKDEAQAIADAIAERLAEDS